MADHAEYSVDPMTAFYAAVTAVENGSVGEIELEFRKEHHDEDETYETIVTMTVRKETRPSVMYAQVNQLKEE